IAGAARGGIRTTAAIDGVVTGAAIDEIRASRPAQRIVAGAGDQVLHIDERLACEIGQPGGEIDHVITPESGGVESVVSRPALDGPRPPQGGDDVFIAGAT